MCILKLIWEIFDYVHRLFNKISTCIISYLWNIHFDARKTIIVNEIGYEHNGILLQGNGDDKSIIIKKKHAHQIKFERTSVNFNMK